MTLTLLFAFILIALTFEFINGFHDTANSIATVVATKVLTPTKAIMLAASMELVGALSGTAVAKTISTGIVDTSLVQMGPEVLICALVGGIAWNLLTWWLGLPLVQPRLDRRPVRRRALARIRRLERSHLVAARRSLVAGQGPALEDRDPDGDVAVVGFTIGFTLMGLLLAVIST
jgi:PiT family inorganic phosphate transporter